VRGSTPRSQGTRSEEGLPEVALRGTRTTQGPKKNRRKGVLSWARNAAAVLCSTKSEVAPTLHFRLRMTRHGFEKPPCGHDMGLRNTCVQQWVRFEKSAVPLFKFQPLTEGGTAQTQNACNCLNAAPGTKLDSYSPSLSTSCTLLQPPRTLPRGAACADSATTATATAEGAFTCQRPRLRRHYHQLRAHVPNARSHHLPPPVPRSSKSDESPSQPRARRRTPTMTGEPVFSAVDDKSPRRWHGRPVPPQPHQFAPFPPLSHPIPAVRVPTRTTCRRRLDAPGAAARPRQPRSPLSPPPPDDGRW